MAENKDKRELENIDTVEDATKENTDEKKDEYEEICTSAADRKALPVR